MNSFIDAHGDFWMVQNAELVDGVWNRIDESDYAFAMQWITKGIIPGEESIDPIGGIVFWRCIPGANPIGPFASFGGWENVYLFTQYRDVVVGGQAIEMDGAGTFPFGRFIHAPEGTFIGQNAYADLNGRDDASEDSLILGVFGDEIKGRLWPAGQPKANTVDLFTIDKSGNFNTRGASSGSFIDIRSKGAVSGTDCTAALQAAIDDGRPVWIPEGIWIISARLYLHNRTRIFGAGRKAIVLLIPSIPGNIDMLKFDDTGAAEDIVLQSFVIDGNKANQNPSLETTCVHLTGVTKPQLIDMTITGGLIEGAYIYQCPEAKVIRTNASGNGFRRADASGIHLDSCERAYAGGCVTDNNGFHGIILSSTVDSVIEAHFSRGNGFDGSRVQYGSNRNRFMKFISDGNFRGIYFTTDSTLNRCAYGTFIHNEASALVFNNAYNNQFTFNHIEDNQYAVETVVAADKNTGYGNTWRANRSGIMSLVAGSTFNAIAAGAGNPV